jgi:3-hydroxyisobutyrate dehydrogenase
MNVGFIGLGVMGGPMAANILKKGHQLTVFDLDPAAVKKLTDQGAKAAASPKEVGAASEIVVTMLPEPQHVKQVILGANGVAEGLKAGGVVIDMSTIDPYTSQEVGAELKKKGIDMVDSPVGKTSEHAASGTLTLMVGGDPKVIEKVKPVLDCMGSDTYLCGGLGMGHAMKITNNLLATTIMAANTEALAIGAKCGLTLELMMEVMKTTMGNNVQLYSAMPKKAFKGDDSPGFMVKLAGKDVRLAVELARKQGFEPFVGAGAQATLDRAAKMGFADRDTAVLMFIRE